MINVKTTPRLAVYGRFSKVIPGGVDAIWTLLFKGRHMSTLRSSSNLDSSIGGGHMKGPNCMHAIWCDFGEPSIDDQRSESKADANISFLST